MRITQTELKRLFNYNAQTGLFIRRIDHSSRARAGDVVGTPAGSGYLNVCINYRKYIVHRLVWLYVYGHFPPHDIDHINRVKTDNRLANLRSVTRSENQHNLATKQSNTSGFTGVRRSPTPGKWCARITIKSEEIALGTYASAELANAAYQTAKRLHHPTAPTQ